MTSRRAGARLLIAAWLVLRGAIGAAGSEGEAGGRPPSDSRAAGVASGLLRGARMPWTGDLDGMLERKYLRVLVVSSRTLYFVERGHQRGLTYDSFRQVEAEIERAHGRRDFHVVFIPVARDRLVPSLLEGLGDVAAANLTITPERSELVDFTRPVHGDVDEIIVTGPGSPRLESLDDLSGRTVFVRPSSSYAESLRRWNERLVASGKAPAILEPAPENLEDEDVLEMVSAGLVPIGICDSHVATFWAGVFPSLVLRRDLALRTGGEIAWAIRKRSPLLRAALDATIEAHGVGKAFGNQILRRYLSSAKVVRNAAAEPELRRYREVVGLFEKYARRYDLDPLLMAAQGYQESRLDQRARSRVGAVGIMQIMPATGKELGVGDIREVEPNVHAGVKYVHAMIERHFADDAIDPLDRGLFAFAAYNAGPARIRKLRGEAAKRGLDANVWFRNVAEVVLEKVGREPVEYVANIYKYYVAYSLLDDAARAREASRKLFERR